MPRDKKVEIQIIILSGVVHPASFTRAAGPYRLISSLRSNGIGSLVIEGLGQCEYSDYKKMVEHALLKYKNLKYIGISTSFLASLQTRISSDTLVTTDYLPYSNSEWFDLIDLIKKKTNAKIIIGGHKTNEFERDRAIHNYVDHYIYGYADVAILNLLKNSSSPKRIESFLTYEELGFNKIKNSYLPIDVFMPKEGLTIELHRGCIFKCKFCAYPLNGKKRNSWNRDVSLFVDELEYFHNNYQSTNFNLSADTFNDDYEYLEKLNIELKMRKLKFNFAINGRLDLIKNARHADLLLDIGVRVALFGIESTNTDSLKNIRKPSSFMDSKKALETCKASWGNQIKITGSFIVGLPYDTKENIQQMLDYFTSSDCPMDSIEFDPLMVSNPTHDKNIWQSEFAKNAASNSFSFEDETNNWTNPNTPFKSYKATESFTREVLNSMPPTKKNSIKSAAYIHLPNNIASLDNRTASENFDKIFNLKTYSDYTSFLKENFNTTIDAARLSTTKKYVEQFFAVHS